MTVQVYRREKCHRIKSWHSHATIANTEAAWAKLAACTIAGLHSQVHTVSFSHCKKGYATRKSSYIQTDYPPRSSSASDTFGSSRPSELRLFRCGVIEDPFFLRRRFRLGDAISASGLFRIASSTCLTVSRSKRKKGGLSLRKWSTPGCFRAEALRRRPSQRTDHHHAQLGICGLLPRPLQLLP